MTFHLTQKVLFRHCDPAGIVFYPRYFEMVNDAVESFFSDVVGYPFSEMHETHAVPTVKLDASFVNASRLGDELDFAIKPVRIGGASLDLNVTCSCDGEPRFNVDVTLVHVTKEMRSQRWSEPTRDILSSYSNQDLKEVSNG